MSGRPRSLRITSNSCCPASSAASRPVPCYGHLGALCPKKHDEHVAKVRRVLDQEDS